MNSPVCTKLESIHIYSETDFTLLGAFAPEWIQRGLVPLTDPFADGGGVVSIVMGKPSAAGQLHPQRFTPEFLEFATYSAADGANLVDAVSEVITEGWVPVSNVVLHGGVYCLLLAKFKVV